MISVFDGMASRDYTKIGDCVLTPESCRLHQVAAGAYDLTMVHTVDPNGKWRWLVEGNLIKAPVQWETMENAYSGSELWIYETIANAKLRDDPSEPRSVSYQEWNASTIYTVGAKVTLSNRNWQCDYFDENSGQRFIPPFDSPWWHQIPGTTGGGTVIATMGAGTKVIWIEGAYTDTWWKVATYTGGLEGYIKQSELTNEQHQTPEEVQPVTITEQLFRIRKVSKDTGGMTLTVEAEHVSYDMSASLIRKAEIAGASPARAIELCMEGLFTPYTAGNVYTNLTNASDGTYTKTIKGKNLTYALLDPDSGIVATFDAELRRNNWDLYIMRRTNTDRGYRLTYGKNIKGVNWTRHDQDLITRIVPVAKNEAGEELYLDDVYVDSQYISNYPVIRMQQLTVQGQVGKDDGTGTDTVWTEETLKAEMARKAQERYDVDRCDIPTAEVTVDFETLGDTAEFERYRALERALLYDVVRVKDERIGLDMELRVVETEWDAVRQRLTGLKLSNAVRANTSTVAGYAVRNATLTTGKIDNQALTEIIDAAADRAVQILS